MAGPLRRPAGRPRGERRARVAPRRSRSRTSATASPTYPLPPGETPSSYLRRVTWEGARGALPAAHGEGPGAAHRRSSNLIEKLDLAGYFLIVWDIVNFCRRENILVQGRGSAANSAVCYALSITAVDPVRMELLFERFLSEERGEWPDIDLDLPSGDPREKVIQHVYRTYGAARRRDDGERHHVPRPLGRARDGEGRRLLARAGRHARQAPRAYSFGEYRDGVARPLGRDGGRGLRPRRRRA